MFTRQLIGLRERFHPLHRLRQSALMARHVLPPFDRPILIHMHDVDWPGRVRRMRHATYVVENRALEPRIAAAFRAAQRLATPKISPIKVDDIAARFPSRYDRWIAGH